MITAERLRELVSYDPAEGVFTWLPMKPTRGRKKVTGRVAGSRRPDGYCRLTLDGHGYLVHRLAWLYVHGVWPKADIDHINRNPRDNRIANLRNASRSENMANTVMPRHNTSGLKGASWDSARQMWQARIVRDHRGFYLGHFDTPQEAHAAYAAAAKALYGEFARAS